jgi:hypothetical protein
MRLGTGSVFGASIDADKPSRQFISNGKKNMRFAWVLLRTVIICCCNAATNCTVIVWGPMR